MIVIRRGRPRDRIRRPFESEELLRAMVFGAGSISSSQRGVWRPPLEVYETPDRVEIVAELAGIDPDAIDIVIEEDILSIRGVRPDPNVCDHRSYLEARIAYGQFAADVQVPMTADAMAATATYENGFLRISMPKEASRTLIPRTLSDPES